MPGPARARGLLPGFANSADLGGLPLPDGGRVPAGRVVRADTPARLTDDERAAAVAVGFTAVLDLRSREERAACPHPLAPLPGYRALPLIDPAAEARVDLRGATLAEIYCGSLERNAAHIAAILESLAGVSGPGPVLVCCRAGKDRTGMVVALLLDLAGADHEVIAADYALSPGTSSPAQAASPGAPPGWVSSPGRAPSGGLPSGNVPGPDRRGGAAILAMLEHVRARYGSTAGYLRRLGLDESAVEALRRRVSP